MNQLVCCCAAVFSVLTLSLSVATAQTVDERIESRTAELLAEAMAELEGMSPLDRPEYAGDLIKAFVDPFKLELELLELSIKLGPKARGLLYFRVAYAASKASNLAEVPDFWRDAVRVAKDAGVDSDGVGIVFLALCNSVEQMRAGRIIEKINKGEELSPNDMSFAREVVLLRKPVGDYLRKREDPEFQRELKEKAAARMEAEDKANAEAEARQIAHNARKWSDKSGKFQIDAAYVGYMDGKVTIQKLDGSLVNVPLTTLSIPDQQFVQKEVRAKRERDAELEKEASSKKKKK